jgi:hypothetical protein
VPAMKRRVCRALICVAERGSRTVGAGCQGLRNPSPDRRGAWGGRAPGTPPSSAGSRFGGLLRPPTFGPPGRSVAAGPRQRLRGRQYPTIAPLRRGGAGFQQRCRTGGQRNPHGRGPDSGCVYVHCRMRVGGGSGWRPPARQLPWHTECMDWGPEAARKAQRRKYVARASWAGRTGPCGGRGIQGKAMPWNAQMNPGWPSQA